jgi:hypothetical protein
MANEKKHIIFRDDDIAPWSPLDTLKAVNQVHIDKNVPVTLGVIPHPDPNSNGNDLLMDLPMLKYLRTLANNSLFELTQHGYNHQIGGVSGLKMGGALYPRQAHRTGEPSFYWRPTAGQLVGATREIQSEFAGRPYEDQFDAIKQGWSDINEALSVNSMTFIPPWNVGDTNTLTAAHAVGHTLYSSGAGDLSGVYLDGIDVQAATLEIPWQADADWDSYMPGLISETDAALDAAPADDSIGVLCHFWSFERADGSNDPAKIAWLEQYIDHLKSRDDVDFTTLNNQHVLPSSAQTRVALTASNTTPAVGESVTFSGTLSQWDAAQNHWVPLTVSQEVQVWHLLNRERSDDATVSTDPQGQFTFTDSWSDAATCPFYATFVGDTSYRESLSDPVMLTVGAARVRRSK